MIKSFKNCPQKSNKNYQNAQKIDILYILKSQQKVI